MEHTPYKFLLKSVQPGLDFTNSSQKIFVRVVVDENIFDMYPYMEVHMNDTGGIIVDGIVSAEGLEFTSRFGSNETGYEGWIDSKWIWRNNNTTDIQVSDNVGGVIGMGFLHKYHALDVPKTRAWNDTISNIVKDIVRADYSLTDSAKLFITTTTGRKIRYQAGKTNHEFINSLLNRAYSQVDEKSPFLSFFNQAGEFYFCTVPDLFRIGTRVHNQPYVLKTSVDASYDNLTFKKIESISSLGLTVNRPNYKIKLSKYTEGASESETTNISDHILNSNRRAKLLINTDFKGMADYFSLADFGIYRSSTDSEDYNGYKNSLYRKSMFPFRLIGMVAFNKEIMIGRIITLDAGSYLPNKGEKSKEYSGDWIIIDNKLFYDTDGVPYNVIEIGKDSIIVDSNYALNNIME